jgi:hypothetical protein
MNIWDAVSDALATLGVPRASSVYIGELPDEFMVYQLISSPPEQHADDLETLRSYRMQVSYYNRSGLGGLPAIAEAMVEGGFTLGPQREIPYNRDTRHFGLAMEFVYVRDQDYEDFSL